MVTLFQVDKSGRDLFEKDYSIVVIVNKKEVYGVNISQEIKDKLMHSFRKGELNIDLRSRKKKKNRFRLRFHTAVVIKLIEKAIYDLGSVKEMSMEICDDFPGHFHEIKDMIFKHISKIVLKLKPEDITYTKFQKPSLIDNSGKAFRNKDKEKLKNCNIVKLNLKELHKIIKR